jgi:hypothetical protein
LHVDLELAVDDLVSQRRHLRGDAAQAEQAGASGQIRGDVSETVGSGEEVLAARYLTGVERQADQLRADVRQVSVGVIISSSTA